MFNKKMEEKSYKLNFKALPVRIYWLQSVPPPCLGEDRVKYVGLF